MFDTAWRRWTSSLVSPGLTAVFRAPASIFMASSTLGRSLGMVMYPVKLVPLDWVGSRPSRLHLTMTAPGFFL